jgi:hypothetical protein
VIKLCGDGKSKEVAKKLNFLDEIADDIADPHVILAKWLPLQVMVFI